NPSLLLLSAQPPRSTLFPYTTLFRSQPDLRVRVVAADDRGVDVAELVQLGGAEEADVDPARLQPVVEHLGHADHRVRGLGQDPVDRKSTRLNSSHVKISYAVFCLKKK